MTISLLNLVGVARVHGGGSAPLHLFVDRSRWPALAAGLYGLLVRSHLLPGLEFLLALVYYIYFWPWAFARAATWRADWTLQVTLYTVLCGWALFGFWHVVMYASPVARGPVRAAKFNPVDQYAGADGRATLAREVAFTTLGLFQSSAWQCAYMWLLASGRLPFVAAFWAGGPRAAAANVLSVLAVTYWRQLHFYAVHRFMHPWWRAGNGLAHGDVGAFLYRWVHSLHHKSHNPGPWAGLAMHPVEHLFYYSCCLLPLLAPLHPMHFLYAKFHADVSPLGGHDGHGPPGGNSDYHYIHHAHFHVNFGAPLPYLNPDRLFGTFVDPALWRACGKDWAKTLAAARGEPLEASKKGH